jgi:GntR family transcriptional regulator
MLRKPSQPLSPSESSTLPSGPCQSGASRRSQKASNVRQLDKTAFVPLYFQIQCALIEQIHSGELGNGDLLASEWELARAYQVSRVTARQALHGLKVSGYAFSQRGRGTFVTTSKVQERLAQKRVAQTDVVQTVGFAEDIKQRGIVPARVRWNRAPTNQLTFWKFRSQRP